MKQKTFKSTVSLFLAALALVGAVLVLPVTVQAAADPAVTRYDNGHTYSVYNDGLTWLEAQAYCASKGGHLATITSQEEQDLVFSLIQHQPKNNYWLGGSKDIPSGSWKWVTGETFDYKNWEQGKPDNNYGIENCLQMYRAGSLYNPHVAGKWNDLPNEATTNEGEKDFYSLETIGFVCEWDYIEGDRYEDGDFIYIIKSGEAVIVGYKGAGGSVVIPAALGGYPVVEIGSWSLGGGSKIVSLEIGSNVRYIGYVACADNPTLQTLIVGDSVTGISTWAFANCPALTNVSIGSGVDSINGKTFVGCKALTAFTLSAGNPYLSADGNGSLLSEDGSVLLLHPPGRAYDNTSIAASVKRIAIDAFRESSMTALTIPGSVESINYGHWDFEGAFYGCRSLTKVVLEEGVKSIGQNAFSDCTALADVTIPRSVTYISEFAFRCSIEGEVYSAVPGLTIYCYRDSYAHTYAIDNNIRYVLLDPIPPVVTCGCCSKHNHGNGFFERIACFFCRLWQSIIGLFTK